jgi:hypothetical protein
MPCSLSNLLARERGGKEVISEENARINLKRGEQKLFSLIGLQSYDLHSGIASPFETKEMEITQVITWEESKNVSRHLTERR